MVCRVGTHIVLQWGGLFGPWEAGPEGCELYGFIAGEWAPFSGDAGCFESLLAARGASVVPLPTRLPPWAQVNFVNGSVTNWTADPGS
jgi:hypothetical protein